MTGSDFAKMMLAWTPDEREAAILDAFLKGRVPDYIRAVSWHPVKATAVIGGQKVSLEYRVSPWLAVGSDQDPLLVPMRPSTLQAVASHYHSVLLSKKMVLDAFRQSTVQIPYTEMIPGAPLKIPGPDMESPQAFIAHNRLVQERIKKLGKSNLDHVGGHSKNVVSGPNLTDKQLAIYGGYTKWSCNADKSFVDGFFCQSYPGPHDSGYVDYSQLGQVAHRAATLTTGSAGPVAVDLAEAFEDAVLHPLVSNQGPYRARYPSAGPGSVGTLDPPAPPASAAPRGTSAGTKLALGLGLAYALKKWLFR